MKSIFSDDEIEDILKKIEIRKNESEEDIVENDQKKKNVEIKV